MRRNAAIGSRRPRNADRTALHQAARLPLFTTVPWPVLLRQFQPGDVRFRLQPLLLMTVPAGYSQQTEATCRSSN